MKQLIGILVFILVFLAAGVVMHVVLYEKPGIFVWSPEKDGETGKVTFRRTTLLPVPVAEPAAGDAEAESPGGKADGDGNGAVAGTKGGGEKADAPATEPDPPEAGGEKKEDSGEVSLFNGKDLGKWESTKYGGEGDVFVDEEGNLEFGFGAVITGVNWTEDPPALSNYEISFDAMKLDGHDFFCAVTFPVKESHATFVIGGWGGGVVGISCVDDLNASENETMNIEGFENDRWYRIRVRVTDDKLDAWIDDDHMVDLALEDRKISLLPGDIELSVPIGLAAFQTRAQYRNIVWRNLPADE